MRNATLLIRISYVLYYSMYGFVWAAVKCDVINATPLDSQLLTLQFKLGYRNLRTAHALKAKIMRLFIQIGPSTNKIPYSFQNSFHLIISN